MLSAVVSAALFAIAFCVYQHSTRPIEGFSPRMRRAWEYTKAAVAAAVVLGLLIAPLFESGHRAAPAPPAARSGGSR